MVAIGKVVFTSREHIIALEARDKGLIGVTLRYPYEVRKEADYFDDIADEKLPKDMLDLAKHIVGSKKAEWKPEIRGSIRRCSEGAAEKSSPARRSRRHTTASLRRSSISWMRYVVRWKQNRQAANDGSQRRVIIGPQRRPAAPVHGQRMRAECVDF